MSLDPKHQSIAATSIIADKPAIDILHGGKDLDGHFCNPLTFADHPRFDSVETGLGIADVVIAELLEFLEVFEEETVEELHALEIVVDALHDEMRQILVLVGEQPQYLLHRHVEAGGQQQDEELQRGFALVRIFTHVDAFDVQRVALLRGLGLGVRLGGLRLGDEGDCLHALLIFVLIAVVELLDYFRHEGGFALQDEVPDARVELHAEIVETEPA